MLEDARHHHALVVAEDVLGAVAVVHVEVDDGHALDAVLLERVFRPDRNVVEQAEAHGARARRMMAGRAHRAKGVLGASADHEVGGENGGARGVQRRIPGQRAHRGVGIQVHDAGAGRSLADRLDVLERMHAGKLAHLGCRRFVAFDQPGDARGDEVVFDRGEPRGAFRVGSAHVVPCAVGVGDECRRHEPARFRIPS